MFKKGFIALFLLCIILGAQAQQFQHFNKISGTGETRSELAVLDSGFVTMVQDFHNWNALVVREYDTAGSLVDSAHYDFGDFVDNGGDNLVKVPNSSDYILAQSYDESVMLVRFNRQWDTLYTRIYQFQDSLQTICYSLKIDSENKILLTGEAYRKDTRKVVLPVVKFDLDFDLVWESQIDDPISYAGGYYGINILPIDSGYLIGGGSYYIGGQLSNKGLYAFMDRLGNLEWIRFVTKVKNASSLRVFRHSSGDFLYAGNYEVDTVISGYRDPDHLLLGRFDLQGNLVSEKEIGPLMNYFGIDGFTKMLNGNYVIGGRTINDGRFLAHLFCFDEDGNTVWHHRYFYAYEREDCLLENFKPTENGLLAVGEVYDAERRFSNNGDKFQWLLSIDENGCVNPDSCGQYFSEPEFTAYEPLHLYPNPAQNHVVLQWDSKINGMIVELRNVAGNLLLQQNLSASTRNYLLDTSLWNDGMYIIRVISNQGVLTTQKLIIRH